MSTTEQDQMALATGQTFVWHELYSAKDTEAIDFYSKALGFGTESMDMGPMGSYKMLTRDGVPVCGVVNTDNPEMANVPPHWAVYIAVDDVDARLTKCTELGAKIMVQPMNVPTIGRMALIQDPVGAHVWLFKGEPKS